MSAARRLHVAGTVQGVGFRPFVARLAAGHHLTGWVRNDAHGVEIHVEGPSTSMDAFERAIRAQAPPAAHIEQLASREAAAVPCVEFAIRTSVADHAPTARIAPDLAICPDCVREMGSPLERRYRYPYVNCTQCGPRFSIVRALPYDRARTTMAGWRMCADCAEEYGNPLDRRYHAEPIACGACGPGYRLVTANQAALAGHAAFEGAAALLRAGAILAIKGVGGYHLGCDATNAVAVRALRERKYRKSKPFAVMARDLAAARAIVTLDAGAAALLSSAARPIVLAPARVIPMGVAPDLLDLGVMLPYAPIHHLLFDAGAPDVLVMTSGNPSGEPVIVEDSEALDRLGGIADAFLVGERDIARRVEDSVVRWTSGEGAVLRRGRGYAPAVVAALPTRQPILALGADLKNTIALVVDGQVIGSQHVGDLDRAASSEAFRATIDDFMRMYRVEWDAVVVAHDQHPHYRSSTVARDLPADRRVAVQHHRAHLASVLAERGLLDRRVAGVVFDGAGYGDDGTIWGGEFFVGSVADGFARAGSLRPFTLPGGDAAARHPAQAAAGFLADADDLPDLTAPPFCLPDRYRAARRLAQGTVRTFTTTSAGRLFDTAAALLGFTRPIAHEGEAAVWLEHTARRASACEPLPYRIEGTHLDFRPAMRAIVELRLARNEIATLARAFHETVAEAIALAAERLCEGHGLDTVVVSGGTFQNALLLDRLRSKVTPSVRIWTNRTVPPNDGGISLGQAAIVSVSI